MSICKCCGQTIKVKKVKAEAIADPAPHPTKEGFWIYPNGQHASFFISGKELLKDKERRRKRAIAYDTQGRTERLQASPNYVNWYERYKEMLPRSMALDAIIKSEAPLPPECPENYSYGEFYASSAWREYQKEQAEHLEAVHQVKQDLIAIQRVVFGDSRAPEALEKQHDDFLLGGSNV